jgi:hypothetical protein
MARRKHYYMGADDMYGGFGQGWSPTITGPLVGGGAAQAGTLAAKWFGRTRPGIAKWAPTIGTVLGAAASGVLWFTGRRDAAISGMLTAALIGIPRQMEDLLGVGAMKDYLGVITAEQEMSGYLGDDGMGQNIELLDAGTGGALGVITAEQEMNGAGDVDLLGGGFGANFLS